MTKVRLPDAPGPRSNSKPRPRYGIVMEPPFALPGFLYVEKDNGECWWVPERICVVEEEF